LPRWESWRTFLAELRKVDAPKRAGRMADGYFDTVISLTDARRSALFYEQVIPFMPVDLILSVEQGADDTTDFGDGPKIML
jgi:hypothetical protein